MADPRNDAPWRGRQLHFVGIGGAGMSGLALVARELGASVTGSDRAASAYTTRLRERGIEPTLGHAAENPERRAAAGRELHRADLLAELSALKRCIAVTGTHGKTTTTAMIVHALQACGMQPAYAVGAELRATGLNAQWGAGEWIVVEADESDRSLLKLTPEIAVLTNAELDHHTTYRDIGELHETFRQFMARAGEKAVVWDRPELRALCPTGAHAYAPQELVLTPAGSRFTVGGVSVALSVPGAHNAINAAGALTAAALAGAPAAAAAAALADFQGARRRFELLGTAAGGAAVYDDYAHHPTEVAAVLAAARTLAPRRLVAVFQPHLFSRTRALAREFGAALARGADRVVVLAVYPARERAEDFPGVEGLLIARAAADAAPGRAVAWLPGFEDARRYLAAGLGAGDLVLAMGAGNVDELARSLLVAASAP